MELRAAIEAAGGFRAVSERLPDRVAANTVYYWVRRQRVPAEYVVPLARIVGLEPHAIRPDVFPPAPAPAPREEAAA